MQAAPWLGLARGAGPTGPSQTSPSDHAGEYIRFGFEFGFWEIEEVKVGGVFSQHVAVCYRHGCERFLVRASVKGGVISAHGFCDLLNKKLAKSRPTTATCHQGGPRGPEADFGTLRDMTGEGGLSAVQGCLCPYCGKSTPIPSTGCTVFCRHCYNALSFTEMLSRAKDVEGAATA